MEILFLGLIVICNEIRDKREKNTDYSSFLVAFFAGAFFSAFGAFSSAFGAFSVGSFFTGAFLATGSAVL
ncbi:MAG: hypothetical protein LBU27_08590 [Candidatus Peribacteria bacterium]|nr:hypothetical protein [Candidatus Peribacteria bacterium]